MEAERVGKYMISPLLSVIYLSFDIQGGTLSYQYGKERTDAERMNYLEFIMAADERGEYF